ncbi:MAG: flagellar hook-basal body complex protein FliE [Planctomycetaceae bacterium]|nr:flagellar hook-basal body complex protein FliE [Planctomycetaceae bacterium]
MIENVGGLGPLRGPALPAAAPKAAPVEGERSFKEILQDSLTSVNQLQKDADQVLEKYTKGQATQDQVMVAFKKAQIAFEAMLQIRNKLVDAFEEIQRMRI